MFNLFGAHKQFSLTQTNAGFCVSAIGLCSINSGLRPTQVSASSKLRRLQDSVVSRLHRLLISLTQVIASSKFRLIQYPQTPDFVISGLYWLENPLVPESFDDFRQVLHLYTPSKAGDARHKKTPKHTPPLLTHVHVYTKLFSTQVMWQEFCSIPSYRYWIGLGLHNQFQHIDIFFLLTSPAVWIVTQPGSERQAALRCGSTPVSPRWPCRVCLVEANNIYHFPCAVKDHFVLKTCGVEDKLILTACGFGPHSLRRDFRAYLLIMIINSRNW